MLTVKEAIEMRRSVRRFRDEDIADLEMAEDLARKPAVDIKTAQSALKPLTDELVRLKPVTLASPQQAPAELLQAMRDRGAMKAKGAFYNGKLYIFANNHESAEDVVRTLLHEGIAHFGLRSVINQSELNVILDGVFESMTDEMIEAMRSRSRAYANIDLTDVEGQRELAEEHIAHMAETDPQQSIIQQLVAMIRSLLRGAGVELAWTNDDIVDLIASTRRELREFVPLNRINVTYDVEVAETGDVVEIEERADKAVRQLTKRMGVIQKLQGCIT